MARFEYLRHLRQRRFLAATLGLPALMAGLVGVAVWASGTFGEPERPWAIIGEGETATAEAMGLSLRYPDQASAEGGVASGRIGGYVELRPEGRALARAAGRVPPSIAVALRDRARDYVLSGAPADVRGRLAEPAQLLYSSATGGRPMSAAELVARSRAAVALPLVFALSILFATSFLVQAVSEEKESRVLEVLVTSASPWDLIAGKIIGLGALSLTQTGAWAAIALGALVAVAGLGTIAQLALVPWLAVAASVPFFLLGYLLYASLMVGIGVVIGAAREAQQVASFVGLFIVVPFALVGLLTVRPASPAAVILSLLPPTAPVAMPMRLVLSAVPAASWAVGLGALAASVAAMVWGVGRVFRATMLLTGERPSLRQLMTALGGGGL